MIITAGKFKGRKIIAPDESITRPTLSKVRQGVFNSLFSLIGDFEGKTFLDMFAGSGIMGLEALSRSFSYVVAFEKNAKVINVLKSNYKNLGQKLNLKIGDSLKLIISENNFDVIYVDPPYHSGIYDEILSVLYDVKYQGIVIVECTERINIKKFRLIKEKRYGDKLIFFLQSESIA
ncbi:16S rRNA (guanine(966)-N(2))-methyltransferase RsmD [bacterium]|nr:16S rRNA (guanine(966)-N(2))-methyltransferase RsmD [bacterium]